MGPGSVPVWVTFNLHPPRPCERGGGRGLVALADLTGVVWQPSGDIDVVDAERERGPLLGGTGGERNGATCGVVGNALGVTA